jgi:hypothetical protein
MASSGSTVAVGWLAAVLTGLTTMPAGATYTVSGHDNAGKTRWGQDRVIIIADASLNHVFPGAATALERAVQTWQAALQYGPTLEVERGSMQGDGHAQSDEPQNTVRFAPYGEPRAKGALAITLVTCDDRGEIVGADIVLNGIYRFRDAAVDADDASRLEQCPEAAHWGLGPDGILSWDLQSILTHEMGHFLGLGEDHVHPDATMYAYSLPGDTSKRDLASADLDAIESLYPATAPFEPEPGCTGASVTGQSGNGGGWLLLLGMLSSLVLAARRAPPRTRSEGRQRAGKRTMLQEKL